MLICRRLSPSKTVVSGVADEEAPPPTEVIPGNVHPPVRKERMDCYRSSQIRGRPEPRCETEMGPAIRITGRGGFIAAQALPTAS